MFVWRYIFFDSVQWVVTAFNLFLIYSMNEFLVCHIVIATFAPQTNVALDVLKRDDVSAALFAPGWVI